MPAWPTAIPKLLLIEDEESLAGPIKRGLEEEGYTVDLAVEGQDGLVKALSGDYDTLVVDWRLPGMDGRTLVERLRGARCNVPVLMLTALHDVSYRVAGLDAGADDYLTKPFSFEELLARLRALRRRTLESAPSAGVQEIHVKAGPLEMDATRRRVTLYGHHLDLRVKEYQLLELLMRRAGEVVSRTLIAERVWGSAFDVTDNAIDVTVSNLRQRLAEVPENGSGYAVSIETVRGVGYRLADVPEEAVKTG